MQMAKKFTCGSLILSFVFLLVSCQQKTFHNTSDFPAVLVRTTPQSQSELTQVVSEALNGVSVTLADDVLTKTSLLIIERARQKGPDNNRILGRDLSVPDQFRLVINGEQCFLIHQKNSNRYLLAKSFCIKN